MLILLIHIISIFIFALVSLWTCRSRLCPQILYSVHLTQVTGFPFLSSGVLFSSPLSG